MQFYPVEGEGGMTQLWHGGKWFKDVPDDVLTPMVIHPKTSQHFYVKELCECTDGSLFIPLRWFQKKDGVLWASGFGVKNVAVSSLPKPCTI